MLISKAYSPGTSIYKSLKARSCSGTINILAFKPLMLQSPTRGQCRLPMHLEMHRSMRLHTLPRSRPQHSQAAAAPDNRWPLRLQPDCRHTRHPQPAPGASRPPPSCRPLCSRKPQLPRAACFVGRKRSGRHRPFECLGTLCRRSCSLFLFLFGGSCRLGSLGRRRCRLVTLCRSGCRLVTLCRRRCRLGSLRRRSCSSALGLCREQSLRRRLAGCYGKPLRFLVQCLPGAKTDPVLDTLEAHTTTFLQRKDTSSCAQKSQPSTRTALRDSAHKETAHLDVAHGSLDSILRQHTAVQLNWRQAQVLCDVAVLDGQHLRTQTHQSPHKDMRALTRQRNDSTL